jgi:hypothetical protein
MRMLLMFKMFKVDEERSDRTSAASGSHPIIAARRQR